MKRTLLTLLLSGSLAFWAMGCETDRSSDRHGEPGSPAEQEPGSPEPDREPGSP